MGGFCSRWFNEGLLTPLPPCLYIPFCFKVLSDNCFCNGLGRIGFQWADRYRAQIMYFAFLASFIATILLCVSCASTSLNAGVVKDTSWIISKVDFDDVNVKIKTFFGLNMFVTECDGDNCTDEQSTTRWTDADCGRDFSDDYFDDDDFNDYCDDCKDASSSTVSTAILSLITMFPQMATDIQRSVAKGDANCQKFVGMLTGFIGFVGTMTAINSYKEGCFDMLPGKIAGNDVHYRAGPSFYCMLFATILKVVDLTAHLIVPVNLEAAWRPEDGVLGGGAKSNSDAESGHNVGL